MLGKRGREAIVTDSSDAEETQNVSSARVKRRAEAPDPEGSAGSASAAVPGWRSALDAAAKSTAASSSAGVGGGAGGGRDAGAATSSRSAVQGVAATGRAQEAVAADAIAVLRPIREMVARARAEAARSAGKPKTLAGKSAIPARLALSLCCGLHARCQERQLASAVAAAALSHTLAHASPLFFSSSLSLSRCRLRH